MTLCNAEDPIAPNSKFNKSNKSHKIPNLTSLTNLTITVFCENFEACEILNLVQQCWSIPT